MDKSHSTLMIYEILKLLLLTVGVEGYLKKSVILLISAIGKSKSMDLIKDDFFEVIIQ